MTARHALYDTEVETLDGQTKDLRDLEGKVALIVNTASQCGFTPQYAGLQQLHERFGGRGLVVMGFPCNQFGRQEPGDAAAIAGFCETRFDVSFPMHAKVEVNGAGAHPLYRHLRAQKPGLLGSTRIKWNFTKFLVNARGEVVQRYAPTTTPEAIAKDIEALLPT